MATDDFYDLQPFIELMEELGVDLEKEVPELLTKNTNHWCVIRKYIEQKLISKSSRGRDGGVVRAQIINSVEKFLQLDREEQEKRINEMRERLEKKLKQNSTLSRPNSRSHGDVIRDFIEILEKRYDITDIKLQEYIAVATSCTKPGWVVDKKLLESRLNDIEIKENFYNSPTVADGIINITKYASHHILSTLIATLSQQYLSD